MASIRLEPATVPLRASVTPPGSKSLTNRAMVTAAVASGTSTLTNALFADDTCHMIDGLRRLGFTVGADENEHRIQVTGRGGHIPSCGADLFCGNSGTTIRFCAALAALGSGAYRLDGIARMRERPIGDLVDGLRRLGAGVEYHGQEGYPPITIHARGLAGGRIGFDDVSSSQFVSALLMAAPAAAGDVLIHIDHQPVSAPYLHMTVGLMSLFGVSVIDEILPNAARFVVPAPQTYQATDYRIEPDASSASYFLAAPSVVGGQVTVEGLGIASLQGDVRFVDVLERMGCDVERSPDSLTVHSPPGGARPRGVEVDLCDMPDTVQTLAVVALFASGPTAIRNVGNLRVKETDRLAALASELTSLGARVELSEDGIVIHPPEQITPATIRTYDDHRMAMSFALAGLAIDGVVIENPKCVNKTFPGFFDRWAAMCESDG